MPTKYMKKIEFFKEDSLRPIEQIFGFLTWWVMNEKAKEIVIVDFEKKGSGHVRGTLTVEITSDNKKNIGTNFLIGLEI